MDLIVLLKEKNVTEELQTAVNASLVPPPP
jgi:hypothetical protein